MPVLRTPLVCSLAIVIASACSDQSGCGTLPLPGGALPADQTIEGGAQIRVTRQGFDKLTAVVPGLINAQIANGFCVPRGNQYSVEYCYGNQGQCTQGCKVNVGLNSTTFSATDSQTLTVSLNMRADADVPTDAPFFDPCIIYVDGNNLRGDADIELRTDPATGELAVRLARIRNVDLSGLSFTGSGGFCSGASSFADFLKDYFSQQIVDYLTPRLDELVQSYLPDPMGLEGVIDVSPLLAALSPGTRGAIETRLLPGGFVTLDSNVQGLSLGVITGINSDEDAQTRTPELDSEPALCVPPLPAPNFGAPPHDLAITARSTYRMPAAPQFSGSPDPPSSDISVGLSETTLDLIGHHAVTSGLLCLGIGARTVPQLTVGTFGLLVPSVAELGAESGDDPVMLVTRPQRAIDFSLGDNTLQSPAITVHLRDLELDVYPFLFERYTRAFTMAATLDIGINLEFDQPTGGPWRIKPTLVGLDASKVQIRVINNQFVRESAAQLEAALPSVFNLLTSQIAIPPINLPTFAGFNIVDPRIARVTSPDDNFLALNATFTPGMMLRDVGTRDPMMADALAAIDRATLTRGVARAAARGAGAAAAPEPRGTTASDANAPSIAAARVRSVETPSPEAIRAALAKQGGALPRVTIDVDAVDTDGRALEWSWRIGDGLWRPFTAAQPLVISDPAFAWQGRYAIGLVSRVRGEPATTSAEQTLTVAIDSVGPRLLASQVAWQGDVLRVAATDLVARSAVRIAFGRVDDDAPRTPWEDGGTASLDRATAESLASDGELLVFLEDPTGNQTIATLQPFHGQPGEAGCNCETSSPAGAGWLALALFVLVRRRRRA